MKITIEIPDDDIHLLEGAAAIRRWEEHPFSPVSRLVISVVEIIHREQAKKSKLPKGLTFSGQRKMTRDIDREK